jgi:hypothetical protein
MSIRILEEQVTGLAEAARLLPQLRRGRPVSPSTIYRWIESGVNGIRLETAMLGGRRVTSKEALLRFFARLNAESDVDTVAAAQQQQTVEDELNGRGY